MCCGWRKLDYDEDKHLYTINLASSWSANKIIISKGKPQKKGSYHFCLYLTQYEFNKLYKHKLDKSIYQNRFQYIDKDYILDVLYNILPELFEDA